jgi:hypothetical protein
LRWVAIVALSLVVGACMVVGIARDVIPGSYAGAMVSGTATCAVSILWLRAVAR